MKTPKNKEEFQAALDKLNAQLTETVDIDKRRAIKATMRDYQAALAGEPMLPHEKATAEPKRPRRKK